MAEVRRIVPNVSADDPDLGRAFFDGLLGLEVGMDMGWIATYVSPTNPAAQVSVLRPGPLAPALTVEVDDVDAVCRAALAAGYRVVYPLTDEPWGVRRFFVAGPGGAVVNVMAHLKQEGRMMNEGTRKARPGGARPNRTPSVSKPRKSATTSKSPSKAGAKPEPMVAREGESTPRLIDQRTRDLGDWREETLARMRELILEAEPGMTEERKWRKPSNGMVGVPVWSHNGIVCTGETYTKYVKLTFARGASVSDPYHLFNSSLEGNARRAIDIREGETIDAVAFKALVTAAVARNGPSRK